MPEETTVDESLPHERIGGKTGADARTGTAQLGDDTVPVGHEDDVTAADIAEVSAEVRLEVANANGLHATNVVPRNYIVKRGWIPINFDGGIYGDRPEVPDDVIEDGEGR